MLRISVLIAISLLLFIQESHSMNSCGTARWDQWITNCTSTCAARNPPVSPVILSKPSHYPRRTMYYETHSCCGEMHCEYPANLEPFATRLNTPTPSCEAGSIIKVDNLVVGEEVGVIGTAWRLVYFSDRVLGRKSDRKINIPLTNSTLDANVTSVDLTITFAGRTFTQSFVPSVNLSYEFIWDSIDDNLEIIDSTSATTSVAQTYSDSTHDTPIVKTFKIGNLKAEKFGLGGWTLSPVHFYDILRNVIYFGNGNLKYVTATEITGGYRSASDDGSEVYLFDSTGRHTSTLNGKTGATLLTVNYDLQGRISSVVDAFSNTTSILRDGSGNLTGIEAPFGQVTALGLDGNGYLESIENPAGEEWLMTYGVDGLLATFAKPGGEVSTFTYFTDGRLQIDSSSAGNKFTFTETVQSATQSSIKKTSNLGRVDTIVAKNPSPGFSNTKTAAGGRSISSSIYPNSQYYQPYNGYAENKSFIDDVRLGAQARFVSAGSVSASGVVKSYSANQSLSTPDPAEIFGYTTLTTNETLNSKTTTSVFTRSTGVTEVTSPLNRKTYLTTDTYGRLVATQTHSYSPVNYSYDLNGRLEEIEQDTRATTFAYNNEGFLASIANPLSQVTSFTYDLAGRVTRKTLPDTRYIDFTYDSDGNLLSVTPPSKPTHSFLKNLWGYITQYLPPDLSGITTEQTTFAYNSDKQLTLVTRPDGKTITFNYHSTAGNLTSVALSGGGGSHSFGYVSGRVGNDTSTDGVKIFYTYAGPYVREQDFRRPSPASTFFRMIENLNNNHLPASDVIRISSTDHTISYGYDDDALLTSAGSETITRDTNTGFITGVTLSNISESKSYDATYGELNSQSTTYTPGPTQLYAESFTRDALGRVDTRTETIGGVSTTYDYIYDSVGRLTDVEVGGVAISSYGYDTNSNRVTGLNSGGSITATYDDQDRLLTYNNLTFTYTDNGELLTKTDTTPTPNDVTTYTYDLFGSLKRVVLSNATQIDYLVDANNRRVARKVNGTLDRWYVWNSRSQLMAELDDSANILARYVYGTKAHVPDYVVKSGTTYKIISDHIGSVRLVVDASTGTVAQRIDYDEFGRVLSDTSPGFQSFGFAGGLYDYQTGLVRFGARDYTEFGRWTSKDPILFAGGDTNLYGYVMNDPINLIDPSGLYWFRQNWQEPGQVGRVGSIVPPAPEGQISDFIESYVPAGYTFGQNHDRFVDWGRGLGAPDWLVNIPSMIPLYGYSIGQEALRSAGIIGQPTPPGGQMCR